MHAPSSPLPLLSASQAAVKWPSVRSVLRGCDGGGRGLPSASRPSPCSEAAPVRFSKCGTAAKALPMPEEFPEQHSRSLSACFETVLCLHFNTALSGQRGATGLSPAINGKHVSSPARLPCSSAHGICWAHGHNHQGNCF